MRIVEQLGSSVTAPLRIRRQIGRTVVPKKCATSECVELTPEFRPATDEQLTEGEHMYAGELSAN